MIRSGISKCFIKVWLKRLSSAAVADTSREIQSPSANIWIENPTKLTAEQRKSLAKDLVVKENFITLKEEENLLAEVSSHLKRLRYEKDHWDDAIHDFREIEKSNWTDINQLIIDRVRQFSFPTSTNYIRFVHVLDLSANGYIKPHIDSVRVSKIPTKGLGYRNDQFRETTKFQYCGDTISGISLLSDSVMKLIHKDEKDLVIDLFLPRRSLYILRGIFRQEFTHEVMNNSKSYFRQRQVPRGRRISVICRNEA